MENLLFEYLLSNKFGIRNVGTLKKTISQRIWLILMDLIAKFAEIFEIDPKILMKKLIAQKEELTKLLNVKPYMRAG